MSAEAAGEVRPPRRRPGARRKGGGGKPAPAPERFAALHTHGPGCQEWLGALNSRGYPCFYFGGKTVLAHRWAYERLRGLIPEGLTVDHTCGNRRCVRVEHLEAVTIYVNIGRHVIGAMVSKQLLERGFPAAAVLP